MASDRKSGRELSAVLDHADTGGQVAKKRKKVRVAFRKNRQKRARDNKLTRQVQQEGADEVDFQSGERLSGKGDLTRQRTVVGVENEGGQILRDVDDVDCLMGRVPVSYTHLTLPTNREV